MITFTALPATSQQTGGIVIPRLNVMSLGIADKAYSENSNGIKVKIGAAQIENLYVWHNSSDLRFAKYNPEIWLFTLKRATEKTEIGKKTISKWMHPCNDDQGRRQSERNNNSYYIGNSKFSIVSEFQYIKNKAGARQFVPVDPFSWICLRKRFTEGYEGEVKYLPLTKTTDLTDYLPLSPGNTWKFGVHGQPKKNNNTLHFRLAIVIDNPDPAAENPKMMGDLSDDIYLRVFVNHISKRVFTRYQVNRLGATGNWWPFNSESINITDAMLTEEGYYMASEDEPNIYLQLDEQEITDAMLTVENDYMQSEDETNTYLQLVTQ